MIGDMSLVGPRPCLFNQKRLISERKKRGVFKVKPGITGLAQISGITMKTPKLLSITDRKMIKQMNLYYYFYYILKTLLSFIKVSINLIFIFNESMLMKNFIKEISKTILSLDRYSKE